jgi:regulator of protease activity HflC (stomatin/prohibitin superfamily)
MSRSKHVDLNENMIRAIAKQVEAERLRRADDQGGRRAAGRREARRGWPTSGPGTTGDAVTLFAALHDTASERSSTIVPLPTDLLTHLVPRPEEAK